MHLLERFRWIAVVPLSLVAAAVALMLDVPAAMQSTSTRLLLALLIGIGLVQLALLRQFRLRLLQPLAALERGSEIILKSHSAHRFELPSNHLLGALPERMQALGEAVSSARSEVSSALQGGAERVNAHRDYLARVLQGLDEGVIVCDGNAQILLYNPAAQLLLQRHPGLGLGRSLFDLLPRAPLEHNRDRLLRQADSGGYFLCNLEESDRLLRCRLSSLGEATSSTSSQQSFVVSFEDVTEQQQQLQLRDRLFTNAIEKMRSPLANLRSAAETLIDYPDIDDDERAAFHRLLASESTVMSNELAELAANESTLLGQSWELAAIYSADLIHLLRRRLAQHGDFELTMTGIPQWLQTDSHALVALLEQLIQMVAAQHSLTDFDLEALASNDRVYLDLSWRGDKLTSEELERCRHAVLSEVVGHPEIEELLMLLGSELWSQTHPRLPDTSMLRLPLPKVKTYARPMDDPLPTRPMIYDFDLFERQSQPDSLLDTPLRQLDYVVFDTETTGLNPREGDEVVSLAAVRIVNQRILPDESFEELVNPGRPIPRDSSRYHGITDAMVEEAPTLDQVLPRFKQFAKDAVLVAHNAWFDMAFIRRYESKANARLHNPILDTLMLSVCLHGREVGQSLDAITERMGIEIIGRHSALGDSMATAKLLLAQIDLLEARGIVTLRQALDAYR